MTVTESPTRPPGPQPILDGTRGIPQQVGVYVFVVVPLLALIAAVPFAWGWGLGWADVAIAAVFYVVSGLGITVGFHRYFTHGSFKASRPLRIALAVAGSLAMQGPVIDWVADHRRHHAFSDKEGDPHSPWLFGTGAGALAKGFWHSHTGWLFKRDQTNAKRFTPDLLADRDIMRVDGMFVLLSAATLLVPALLGGLLTWSWWGALTAFFWAGLVRVALLHHVTWSINSICHMIGDAPFAARDHSPTSGRWRSCRSASRGTTCTTPTPRAPATACSAVRSTSPPGSSRRSRSSAGPRPCAGPHRGGWSASPPRPDPVVSG